MITLDKIFIVIDPTTDSQVALERAGRAATREPGVKLHVYTAVHSVMDNADVEALKRAELARHGAWVEMLVAPIRAEGTHVEVEVEWSDDWRSAIAPAAERAGASVIYKAASSHGVAERRLLKTADWTLLRQASCPVYLIKRETIDPGGKVLLALDIKRDDELHNTLNERVVQYGRIVCGYLNGGELHAVNAYASNENFVYPDDLARKTGIENSSAHTVEGPPDKVIPEVAENIDATIVVIGTVARDGLKAAVIGNTAEKVLDALQTNVLVINAQS